MIAGSDCVGDDQTRSDEPHIGNEDEPEHSAPVFSLIVSASRFGVLFGIVGTILAGFVLFAYGALAMIRERGIVLEICPTSNLHTRVVSGWDEFRWIFDTLRRNDIRFTINTDGPEMLRTYIRDEMAQLGRLGILSVAEQEVAAATAMAASFVQNVSDLPAAGRVPAPRVTVEREEA